MIDFEGALKLEADCLGVVEKHRILVDNDEHHLFIAGAKDILNEKAAYASYIFYRFQGFPNRYLVTYVTREQLVRLEDGYLTLSSLLRPQNFVAFVVDLDPENEEVVSGVSVMRVDDIPGHIFPDEEELDVG